MTVWCVVCSMAWAVALTLVIGLFVLAEVDANADPKRPRTFVHWMGLALFLLLAASVGSCAAEERVCELAGLEADP